MSPTQERLRDPGSHQSGPGLEHYRVRARARLLCAFLARDWVTIVAAVAIAGVVYLSGPAQSDPAKRVALNEVGGQVRSLSFSNGGRLLAATTLDGMVRRFRVDFARVLAAPGGPAVPGFLAAFSPDGATLAVAGDSTLSLWDVPGDARRETVRTGAGWTSALAFRAAGGALAVAGARLITFWDTASARAHDRLQPLPCAASALAFAPDGRSLASGGQDGFIRIWDPTTGRVHLAIAAHQRYVTSLAFSDDGRLLASASHGDRTAQLWDAATGRRLVSLRGHTAMVQCVAFAPSAIASTPTLATAATDGTVRLWDATMGHQRAILDCGGLVPGVIAFSADGRTLAAGGIEPAIWSWDIAAILGRPDRGNIRGASEASDRQ
jgi:WD40 repeat protein